MTSPVRAKERLRFSRDNTESRRIQVDDDVFDDIDLYLLARFDNVSASIYEEVFKCRNDKYVWVTTVYESVKDGVFGHRDGWYVAITIDGESAAKLRRGWNVIHDQPRINHLGSRFDDIRHLLWRVGCELTML